MNAQENITTNTFQLAKLSIPNLIIYHGKDLYAYDPKEDVTNIELACLIRLFVVLAYGAAHHADYDSFGFIEKHGLQRHFEKMVQA